MITCIAGIPSVILVEGFLCSGAARKILFCERYDHGFPATSLLAMQNLPL